MSPEEALADEVHIEVSPEEDRQEARGTCSKGEAGHTPEELSPPMPGLDCLWVRDIGALIVRGGMP